MTAQTERFPYVAAMTPIVGELTATMPSHVHPNVLWWALAVGADFGGNLTAVGASANIVMFGIARLSLGIAAVYLWMRYFVLS